VGTTLAVVLALQGVALVDSQINDDRASVGATSLLPRDLGSATTRGPDDSVAQIGVAITPDPFIDTGAPTTQQAVQGALIITAAPPPPAEPPTTEPPAPPSSARPRTSAPATDAATAPATPDTTAPPTVAPTPTETQPPATAAAEQPDDAASTTRPRSNSRSATTTTGRRATTTTEAEPEPPRPEGEPGDSPNEVQAPGVGTKTFLTPGGQISVEARGGQLTLVFARPRPEFTQTILVQAADKIDVRFASDNHSYRVVVNPIHETEFVSTNIIER
jgi:hypothetical protein